MNFFFLDNDPRQAARDCCDKHVWKMHTEGIQMFVQLLIDLGIDHDIHTKGGTLHKGCHKHPCLEWLKQSIDNVYWAIDHVDELIEEHHRRKNRAGDPVYSRVQFDQFVHDYLGTLEDVLPNVGMTPPAQAMPDEFRDDNAVTAYRAYYIGDKHKIAEWRYCDAPDWFTEAFDYAGVAA